jgi:hypothetical protein
MADDSHDLSDYRDAIEGLLLDGEVLEAVFPATPTADSDDQNALGITSHRLIHCERILRKSSHDRWVFRTVLYSHVEGLDLTRHETFRRDRIEASSAVGLKLRQDAFRWHYKEVRMAREVHDRILTHMLAG